MKTKYDFDKSFSNNKNLASFTKNSHEYCTLFDLKQLIKCPTCAKCNSSSILDNVLASFPDRVSQSCLIDAGILDHQLIYCTRKTARIKSYYHKQITFRFLKNYSPETYKEAYELQKRSISNVNCLENDESAIFDVKDIDNLLNCSNKYGVLPVAQYYSHLGLTKKFDLLPTEKDYVFKILRDIDTSKAAGINRFPGRFLEEGTNVLAKLVTDICNFQYL